MVMTVAKLLVAGAALAAICWLAYAFFFAIHPHAPLWQNALVILLTIGIGAGTFFGAAYLLRVAEVHDVVGLVRRKFKS
jgi:hypothetical protein